MSISILAPERRRPAPEGETFIIRTSRTQDVARTSSRERCDPLSRIFGQSPVSMVITDKAGRIEHVNHMFCRVTGYSAGEVIGKNPRLLKSGKMPPEIYRQLWETILSGREWRGELLNRRKNGELYWESSAISPIYNDAGDITHFLSVNEDITERVEMEAQLAEVLDFNWKIISGVPVGIVVFKHTGQCVLANDAAIQIIQGPQGSSSRMLQQNFRELESWRTSGLLAAAEEALVSQIPQAGEFHLVSSFGRDIQVAARFNCFRRNNELHLLLTLNDITDRRQAEEKARLQTILLNEATDAIWGLDLNERINYWNKGAERVYGWSAAEAIGKNPVELLSRGIMTPQLQECINTVKSMGVWAGELEEFAKDGRSVIVQGRCNAIRDDQGRLQSLLIINTDITEKKKMETQFLRSQRMESLGTLAGGIAHDLNNILAPLLISVQLLREQVTNSDGQQLLQTLEANVERGASLIRQVLAFGRGARGERVPVQLDHILREIEQIIRETFPKSIEFEAPAVADLWNVTGDATQLHQVLLNLCVNARDAMPDGGKLTLQTENVVLDETVASLNLDARPGSYVMIRVADTGVGIPKQVQDRMFEPFFTTKAPGKGTGLGLSTCIGIIKGHHGFIHCYSEPGKGSAFKVYLPATVPVPALISSVPDQGKPSRGQGELVLVVDDEKVLREIARNILEKFGYRVVIATNGAEAVALYRQQQNEIAAVLMDIAMPVMDGPAAIAALRAINSQVKIIGTSGLDIHGPHTNSSRLDTQHFMSKPYSAKTLLNTLQKALAIS